MGADPVTAIGNAVSEFFGTVKPIVEDALQQKYENEFKDRLAKWNDIMAEKDPDSRADRMQSFLIRLCGDAGATTGGLGENYSVPLAFLSALVSIAANKVKGDQLIASLRFKQ